MEVRPRRLEEIKELTENKENSLKLLDAFVEYKDTVIYKPVLILYLVLFRGPM
jgi:hypothetical protein